MTSGFRNGCMPKQFCLKKISDIFEPVSDENCVIYFFPYRAVFGIHRTKTLLLNFIVELPETV